MYEIHITAKMRLKHMTIPSLCDKIKTLVCRIMGDQKTCDNA